jgi:glycosyltransferase involved in cell wall biosynthesis
MTKYLNAEGLNMSQSWICCQLGAREHFAIPRALHQAGLLALFITDTWISTQPWLGHLSAPAFSRLRQRFHPELASAPVRAFPASTLHFEIVQHLRRREGWERIIARNRWFQEQVVGILRSIKQPPGERPIVFAYSYAARDILRYAKSRGWRTVLGQIDPGPIEEDLVAKEHRRQPSCRTSWQPAPAGYWRSWMEECRLADRIVVNSGWSGYALRQAGIAAEKIAIVHLAYQPPTAADDHIRRYPDRFTADRPLRVLFLGQVILRKGIAAVLAAAKLLKDRPIEFWLVGPTELDGLPGLANMRWVGPVSRNETARYYREADVFLFPTISDGFGLTQLEAQAWKLPVIASRSCGEVVRDRVNGLVLPQATGDAIVSALMECVQRPRMLAALAQEASRAVEGFTLATLRQNLEKLDDHSPFSDGSERMVHAG